MWNFSVTYILTVSAVSVLVEQMPFVVYIFMLTKSCVLPSSSSQGYTCYEIHLLPFHDHHTSNPIPGKPYLYTYIYVTKRRGIFAYIYIYIYNKDALTTPPRSVRQRLHNGSVNMRARRIELRVRYLRNFPFLSSMNSPHIKTCAQSVCII